MGSMFGSVRKRLRRRQVPVVRQLSEVECGAACLAMILGYHGRKTRVSEVRDSFSIGRDGVTALSIVRAARSHGLRVKAYTLNPSDFEHVPLPAIVHWDFNHFVVVERWSPDHVDVVDPAIGRRRLTADEFDIGFTGVVLTFEPGVQFQRSRRSGEPTWRNYLSAYLAQSPKLFIQILLSSLFLLLLGLVLPTVTKILVDEILPLHLDDLMQIFGLGIGVVILAHLVTSYLRAALLIRLQARLDMQMMLGFFEHLLSLPFRYFEQRTSGDLLMRLGSNAIIRETLTSQTLSILFDGALVIGYLGVLLYRDLFYGVLVLVVALIQVGLLFGTGSRLRDLAQRDLGAQAESQSYLVEALKGVAALKASGAEDRALDHWSNLFFKQLNVSLQRNHLVAVVETFTTAFRTFAPLVLLWVGALRVLDGSMSLGTMLALNALATSFLAPLASLVTSGQRLQVVKAHLDRLTDVLEAQPEQDRQAVRPAPVLTGRIELKNVGFRYDPNTPYVLKDISVTIEPGRKVAIVGPSGAGKSTLVKLLLGLYPPTEGDIFYDGIPVQHLDYRTVRSQFGVVLQEAALFSGSIRENITLNNPAIPLDQVVAAARLAGLHDDIMRMPMAYETRVAEGGTGLSGGQRQRLSIARALAHRPPIVLLDEATSHLDVATEALVEQNFSQLQCTRIVIAHRLSTVQNADIILVVNDGTIVERGRHEELLAQGGYYAQLIQSQLGAQRQDDVREPRALPPAEQPALKPLQAPVAAQPAPAPTIPSAPAKSARQVIEAPVHAAKQTPRVESPRQTVGWLRPIGVSLGTDLIALPRTRSLRIGRDDNCELQLFDARVSRYHARIDYRLGEFILFDENSHNGVYVNGRRIQSPTVLRDGDRIEIGEIGLIAFNFESQTIPKIVLDDVDELEPAGAAGGA